MNYFELAENLAFGEQLGREDMDGEEVLQKAQALGLDWSASSVGGYFQKFAERRKKP